jgi:hypothetical protein
MFSGILAFLFSVNVSYVPEPQLKIVDRGFGPRCGCRTEEVRIVIDGVPVAPPFHEESRGEISWLPSRSPGVAKNAPLEPWRVVLPVDPFMKEMVLNGQWIETRPRLRVSR